MFPVDLTAHEITVSNIRHNLSSSQLYEDAIRYEPGSRMADSGALVAYCGAKTGRSPKDKRVVRHPESEARHLVGQASTSRSTTTAFLDQPRTGDRLSQHARAAVLSSTPSPAGTRTTGMKIRVICSRPYHALFMHNMLIRPTRQELHELRRARLRDLQRRRVPRQPPHRRHDVEDQRRPRLRDAANSSFSAPNTPAK